MHTQKLMQIHEASNELKSYVIYSLTYVRWVNLRNELQRMDWILHFFNRNARLLAREKKNNEKKGWAERKEEKTTTADCWRLHGKELELQSSMAINVME